MGKKATSGVPALIRRQYRALVLSGTAVYEVEALRSAIPLASQLKSQLVRAGREASAVHEYVSGDFPFLLVQVEHRTLQYAVGVGAARVHREGPAELLDPLALVDMPVHRQDWLVLEDGFPDRLGTDRLHDRASMRRPHVLSQGARLVEAGAVGLRVAVAARPA